MVPCSNCKSISMATDATGVHCACGRTAANRAEWDRLNGMTTVEKVQKHPRYLQIAMAGKLPGARVTLVREAGIIRIMAGRGIFDYAASTPDERAAIMRYLAKTFDGSESYYLKWQAAVVFLCCEEVPA